MYVRVVRFTDVDKERVDALLATIDEAGGPPPVVATTGLTLLFDESATDRGRSAVLQHR